MGGMGMGATSSNQVMVSTPETTGRQEEGIKNILHAGVSITPNLEQVPATDFLHFVV